MADGAIKDRPFGPFAEKNASSWLQSPSAPGKVGTGPSPFSVPLSCKHPLGRPIQFRFVVGGRGTSIYPLRNPFQYVPPGSLDNPVETLLVSPAAEPLKLFSPSYVPLQRPPPANPPALETIVAPTSSSEGATAVLLSSRILLFDALDAWRAVRPLFRELPETSPDSITTFLGRLATEVPCAGALKTGNSSQKVRLPLLQADARDWHRDQCQLASTSSKRPHSADPDKEVH